ncbi:hypothetical protein ACX0G9_29505 [Flavitalea flava]
MISSKFSFWKMYFPCLILAGFLSVGLYLVVHPNMQLRDRGGGYTRAVYPGLFFSGLICLLILLLLKRIKVLRIQPDLLLIKSLFSTTFLQKEEISSINLAARERIYGNGGMEEAISIELADGRKIVLDESVYRNAPELKRRLRDWYGSIAKELPDQAMKRETAMTIPESGESVLLPRLNPVSTEISEMETFSGNYLSSGNMIMFCALTTFIFILMKMTFAGKNGFFVAAWVTMGVFVFLLYISYGFQLFYFQVSSEFLWVRNHFFPWLKRQYPINEINRVVFEIPSKRSNGLRVVTNDFESRLYCAGSLRKVDWQGLREKLEELKITFVKD